MSLIVSVFNQFASISGRCLLVLVLLLISMFPNLAEARNIATPWTDSISFQNLVYGSSSFGDVQRIMGKAPDEVLRSEQMYPIVDNYYYYDEQGTGAATVFVFEDSFLVGLHYKSPENQFIDFTYFLTSNFDRNLNSPYLAGYQGYFPYFPLYNRR